MQALLDRALFTSNGCQGIRISCLFKKKKVKYMKRSFKNKCEANHFALFLSGHFENQCPRCTLHNPIKHFSWLDFIEFNIFLKLGNSLIETYQFRNDL